MWEKEVLQMHICNFGRDDRNGGHKRIPSNMDIIHILKVALFPLVFSKQRE